MRILALLVLAPLAACTTNPDAFVDDPRAQACRERAAVATGTLLAETSASFLGTDVGGLSTYRVRTQGGALRCTTDQSARVIGLSRS
jgi:hypothetical protein